MGKTYVKKDKEPEKDKEKIQEASHEANEETGSFNQSPSAGAGGNVLSEKEKLLALYKTLKDLGINSIGDLEVKISRL